MPATPLASALNLLELQRYLNRVSDRWPLSVVMLAGARIDDFRGAPSQRERGPEYVVVLVSPAFEGMPWLERVYQATSLWDGMEMGDSADVHCYTTKEFDRKKSTTPAVRAVIERGLLLFEDKGEPREPSLDSGADGVLTAADGGLIEADGKLTGADRAGGDPDRGEPAS